MQRIAYITGHYFEALYMWLTQVGKTSIYYCDVFTIRRSPGQVGDWILLPLMSPGGSGIIQNLVVKAAYILFELAMFWWTSGIRIGYGIGLSKFGVNISTPYAWIQWVTKAIEHVSLRYKQQLRPQLILSVKDIHTVKLAKSLY